VYPRAGVYERPVATNGFAFLKGHAGYIYIYIYDVYAYTYNTCTRRMIMRVTTITIHGDPTQYYQ